MENALILFFPGREEKLRAATLAATPPHRLSFKRGGWGEVKYRQCERNRGNSAVKAKSHFQLDLQW